MTRALIACALSLELVVQGLLGVPIEGSIPLFLAGIGILASIVGTPCSKPVGMLRVKVDPLSTALWTEMSPPSRLASCLERVNPRPVPPNSRLVEAWACTKGSKTSR